MNAKKIIRCLQFNQIIFFCDFIRGAPAYPNELVLLDNQSTLSKAGKVTFDLGHSVLGVLGMPREALGSLGKSIYTYMHMCVHMHVIRTCRLRNQPVRIAPQET